jgi:energy-coupling factor transporter ATP-binding protein EcfA2
MSDTNDQNNTENSNLKFHAEKPYKITGDGLKEIENIAEEIIDLSTDKKDGGITYAITGDWGSGKTSYLKTLENILSNEESPIKGKKCKTFFYEAWKYQNDSVEPIVSLLNLIVRALKDYTTDNPDLSSKIKKSIIKITKAVTLGTADIFARAISNNNVNIGYAEELLTKIEDLENEKYIEELGIVDKNDKLLEELIKDTKELCKVNKLVIFIDDVDRVVPKKAFDIIDSMRFYLRNLEDVIVIFGINSKVISKYVEKNYTLKDEEEKQKSKHNIFSGEEFIEKLFDARESLEPKGYNDINETYQFEELLEDTDILEQLNHLPYRKWRLLFNAIYKKYKKDGKVALDFKKAYTIILSECYPRFYFCTREILFDSLDNDEFKIDCTDDKDKIKKLEDSIDNDCLNFSYLEFNIMTQKLRDGLSIDKKKK